MSQNYENDNRSLVLGDTQRAEHLQYCLERYGVEPTFWDTWDLVKRKEGLWIFPRGSFSELQTLKGELREESSGLRLFSGSSFPYKVTHQFGLFCKDVIQKGWVDINEDNGLKVLRREELPSLSSTLTHPGYYLARVEGQFVGIVLLSQGQWVSQVPKSLKAQLPQSLRLTKNSQ